jgi:hypothetical protein
MAEPDWLELAWKLSGSGMSKTRFAEVYADKIGRVPAGSHSAKAAVAALAPAPEPTNDAVSDERLRDEALTLAKDEGADFVLVELGKALGHEHWTQQEGSETWDGDVHATLMHLLRDAGVLDPETDAPLFGTRRSITSQASEGAVVAWRIRERPGFPWQFVDYDPARMPNVRGWEHEPLYASPSKRVERLETKIEALIVAATDARNWLGKSLTAKRVDDAISELRQALQGGRS